jgi:hypothetical protein
MEGPHDRGLGGQGLVRCTAGFIMVF